MDRVDPGHVKGAALTPVMSVPEREPMHGDQLPAIIRAGSGGMVAAICAPCWRSPAAGEEAA